MVQARRGPRMPRTGTVHEFDADRGLGTVVDPDGRSWPFHCTAIVDESRTIDPGTPVSFVLAAGHLGRIEARNVAPLPPSVGPR